MISVTTRAAYGALALCAAALAAPAASEAREILETSITLDLGTGAFDAKLSQGPDKPPFELTSARQIADGAFVKLDMKVSLTAETRERLEKMVDQGFTSEPSGCEPGAFQPLDMEDGLRYFFDVGLIGDERVRATIYPGNRSTHWANDVFCEYDPKDADAAIFRLTGFFYVIHRQLPDAIDVQLRPITLSTAEVEKHMTR